MRAGTTKLDGWKITPVNFMLCTFGYLGSKYSGSNDVKPEKDRNPQQNEAPSLGPRG